MYTLFFDTETTGFPKRAGWDEYFDPKQLKAYDSSRIVSISWIIRNIETNFIKAENFIISPQGFLIDNEGRACQINGITQEKAEKEGKYITEVFDQLDKDIKEYNFHYFVSIIDINNNVIDYQIFQTKGNFDLELQPKEVIETLDQYFPIEIEEYYRVFIGFILTDKKYDFINN